MEDCVSALEAAYVELAAGRAVSPTRTDALVPALQPEQVDTLRTMSAAAPHFGVGAVRIVSLILSWPNQGGSRRRVKILLSALTCRISTCRSFRLPVPQRKISSPSSPADVVAKAKRVYE